MLHGKTAVNRVDRGLAAAGSDDPGTDVGLDCGVGVASRQRGPLRVEEAPKVRGQFGQQASAGRAEQERVHQTGLRERRLGDNSGPQRGTDKVTPPDAQVVEGFDQVCRVAQGCDRRRRRLPEAPEVKTDRVSR